MCYNIYIYIYIEIYIKCINTIKHGFFLKFGIQDITYLTFGVYLVLVKGQIKKYHVNPIQNKRYSSLVMSVVTFYI